MLIGSPVPVSLLILIATLVLWVVGLMLPLNETNRFRILSIATLLTAIVLGGWFGWKQGLFLTGSGVWIAAIIRGIISPPKVEEAVPHGASHH